MKIKHGAAINFNKNLYALKAVKSAQKAYGDLADFRLMNDKKYIKVVIKNIKPDAAENFELEFCNYVLGLMAGSSIA